MADLRVCSTCGETEDCACQDLSAARRKLTEAEREVRRALGWYVIRLVQQMPDACGVVCGAKEPADRCPLCRSVARARKAIDEVLP